MAFSAFFYHAWHAALQRGWLRRVCRTWDGPAILPFILSGSYPASIPVCYL